MNDNVLIYLRGESSLRDIAWSLLEKDLIITADSIVRHEAYLKNGTKRKMSSNQHCMLLVARREMLDDVMAYIREVKRSEEVSAYAVPVLSAV